jgi:alpha-methylacyl-CoA racemase
MGPLAGIKVVELASIGPGPFCCMLLADMGAEVVRVDRAANVGKSQDDAHRYALLTRSRRNVAVDLKRPQAVAAVLRLIDQACGRAGGRFPPGRDGASRPWPRALPEA